MRLVFKQEVKQTASTGVLSMDMDICSVRYCESGRIQRGFDWNSSAAFESLTQSGFHGLQSSSKSKADVILGITLAFSILWVLPSCQRPCWVQGWSSGQDRHSFCATGPGIQEETQHSITEMSRCIDIATSATGMSWDNSGVTRTWVRVGTFSDSIEIWAMRHRSGWREAEPGSRQRGEIA